MESNSKVHRCDLARQVTSYSEASHSRAACRRKPTPDNNNMTERMEEVLGPASVRHGMKPATAVQRESGYDCRDEVPERGHARREGTTQVA